LYTVKLSLLACFLCFAASAALGAAHTHPRLLLDTAIARPGETVMAGLQLRMDPNWHTYWRNPGEEGGLPTTIEWTLPEGIKAGDIKWPVPEKLRTVDSEAGSQPRKEVINFVYDQEAVLLIPLQIAKDFPETNLTLSAKVKWLECTNNQCVPGGADVQAGLSIGPESRASSDRTLLQNWESKLPKDAKTLKPQAHWADAAGAKTRGLTIEWTAASAPTNADFYPDKSDDFEIDPAVKKLSGGPLVRLQAQVNKLGQDWPKEISGLLIEESATGGTAYDARMPIENGGTTRTNAPVPSGGAESGLWLMLLYAFIGGMILNVMPCVLPVIALKILGFVNEAKNEPGRVRKLGLVYALGVIVSFEVLAGIIIALIAAGKQAGWGLQFGNPQFLVLLTVLVTLVALNLFGLFEVTAGRITDTAGQFASKHGFSGAFLNGVLATILATPCTAPFMSVALGFAFAQPPSLIILVFLMIAAGLAFPYVLLSFNPQWLKFLPKPGAWMENFKIIMGFPMLATAIWLFSLTTVHYGGRSWWLGIFLVIVGLAAWMYGRFVQRGESQRGLAMGTIIVLLLLGYFGVVEGRLHWRIRQAVSGNMLANQPEGIPWQPWSSNAVSAARAQGRPILVDFTAEWCVTCNTIVKPALSDPSVKAKLDQINAVALLADYTQLPDNITQELKRYRRAGVPMVLAYPRNAAEPAIVLPDPSPLRGPGHFRGLVLDALDRAGQ
jgi:thiol:disulfide interchange protein DsbD